MDLLDRLLKFQGVIGNIYGDYSNKVVYDQDKERAKNILFNVYGYKNIYELLPPELDEQKTMDHMRTLMSMDIYQNPETTSLGTQKEKVF